MWREREAVAQWLGKQWCASVDLHHPEQGLRDLRLSGRELSCVSLLHVLPLELMARGSMQLTDHYVRDHDLIAVYQDADRQLRSEIYWRVASGQREDVWVCDAIVSVQTELLDGNPRVEVGCAVPAESCRLLSEPDGAPDELFRSTLLEFESGVGVCGLAFPLSGSAVVMSLLFDAADVVAARLDVDRAAALMWPVFCFFSGRLEKGVIRRTRLRAILSGADQASDIVRSEWKHLKESPPPLAT